MGSTTAQGLEFSRLVTTKTDNPKDLLPSDKLQFGRSFTGKPTVPRLRD